MKFIADYGAFLT